MSGPVVKNHVSLKMVFGLIVIRRTAFLSWSRIYLQLPLHRGHQQLQSLPQESTGSTQSPVSIDSERERADEHERRNPVQDPTKNSKTNKNEDHEHERSDPSYSEIPEWLQEFRENLVDESVPEFHGARVPVLSDSHASSSHEPSLEPLRRVVSGNHSIYIHFPKDRNCKICSRTKITRAPCRRRIGGVVPRAENFGDLITADHKIFSDGSESRHSHRCAIVVQDLAAQWIQSYPRRTKTSQETERSLQKFLDPSRKPKVIYTDNSLEFGKACEDLTWNHCTSTPHRSETNGIAERAVRRVKEGSSAVLLQSGLNESWWAHSMECYTYLRNVTDLLSDGKTPYERRFGQPFKGPIIPFGSLSPHNCESGTYCEAIHVNPLPLRNKWDC